MTKLFDLRQLAESEPESEQPRRARVADWTADLELAKPARAQPEAAPAMKSKTPPRDARRQRGPGPARQQPEFEAAADRSTPRRVILAVAGVVLTVFIGIMAVKFAGRRESPVEDAAIKPAQSTEPAAAGDAGAPSTQASAPTRQDAPRDASSVGAAPTPRSDEIRAVTILPDGSLAPEGSTPRANYEAPSETSPQELIAPTPPVAVAPATTESDMSRPASRSTEPVQSGAATPETLDRPPPVAKPAKKHASTQRAAKPVAKSVAKPAQALPAAAPKAEAESAPPSAPAKEHPAAAAAADDEGIFESAQHAVGSITGAVKKLVGDE